MSLTWDFIVTCIDASNSCNACNKTQVTFYLLFVILYSGPGRGSLGPGKNFFVGPFLSIF